MANTYHMTSESLISSVKRRASIPDAQSLITDNEILEFANEEMALNLIPLIYSKHQDYYLVREVVQLVSGQTRYEIPYRAIGNKLREVAYQDSSGNLSEMFRISSDEVASTGTYGDNGSTNLGRFYIEGEEIVLHRDESTFNGTGSIVIFYNLRPNVLVESDTTATLLATPIDNGDLTTTLQLSAIPDNFTLGSEIDFIGKRSPHKIITFDNIITAVDANLKTITLATANIPSKLAIGDSICSAGETNLVNSPSDLHVLLAQMTAARVLESIGDNAGLKAADKKIQKMEQNADLLLANRVTGSPVKAINRNGGLRSSGLGSRGRRGWSNNK